MTGVSWSGSVGYAYDTDFRVAGDLITAPTGTNSMQFGYDSDSLLTCASPTSCSPVASDALTLCYRSDVPLVSGTTVGTISDAFSYNAYGELASASTRVGPTLLYSEVLDSQSSPRDMLGRITLKAETRGTSSQSFAYTYDSQGRLTDVYQGVAAVEHFEYDPNGNRLKGSVNGTTRSATYDDQDRLLTYGPYTYSYTPNGELFTKTDSETGDVTTYYYDALGNLLSVEPPDSTLIEYVIDGQNRRIGKIVDGVLSKAWLYKDQLKPIAELDGSGNLTARFVYGSKTNTPDVILKYNGGVVTTYRVISDHLGSPVMAVNVNNASDVPFTAEYSAFGERTVTSDAASEDWMPFGFAGGMYDADTGLTRFGARDYDAEVGRWTAKDPIRFDGGINLYAYVGNDPANLMDLTGVAPTGSGGASSSGAGGEEGIGNTPDPNQATEDPAYEQCIDRCMVSQGADIAGDVALVCLPFAPTPKTSWELGKTLGGGSSVTTWASRAAAAAGLPARNGLRTAGSIAAKATAVPFAAAGGYWVGSLVACAASCE